MLLQAKGRIRHILNRYALQQILLEDSLSLQALQGGFLLGLVSEDHATEVVVKFAATNQYQAHQAHGDDHFDQGKCFCFHGS